MGPRSLLALLLLCSIIAALGPAMAQRPHLDWRPGPFGTPFVHYGSHHSGPFRRPLVERPHLNRGYWNDLPLSSWSQPLPVGPFFRRASVPRDSAQ